MLLLLVSNFGYVNVSLYNLPRRLDEIPFIFLSHMLINEPPILVLLVPESLLHNMEREIDILLLEHTGNAASSKVTMAQAQSSSPSPPNSSKTTTPSTNAEVFASQQQQQPLPHGVAVSSSNGSNSNGMTQASPLVIKRIKDLFANNLPKENVILLREICRSFLLGNRLRLSCQC